MKRDKIVTIRVNAELLKEFERIVAEHTQVYNGRHNHYVYFNEKRNCHEYGKFTLSDLVEDSLKRYCNTFAPGKM